MQQIDRAEASKQTLYSASIELYNWTHAMVRDPDGGTTYPGLLNALEKYHNALRVYEDEWGLREE